MNHIPFNQFGVDKTRCLKVLMREHPIVTINKHMMDINKKYIFNRWVPPSVSTNNELYAIYGKYYHSHYIVCAQKDIVKTDNHTQE